MLDPVEGNLDTAFGDVVRAGEVAQILRYRVSARAAFAWQFRHHPDPCEDRFRLRGGIVARFLGQLRLEAERLQHAVRQVRTGVGDWQPFASLR